MVKSHIEEILTKAFRPRSLRVIDESHKHIGHAGAKQGGHFRVEISSEAFNGKKSIDCHYMIYAALEPIKSRIHALSIQTKGILETPEAPKTWKRRF